MGSRWADYRLLVANHIDPEAARMNSLLLQYRRIGYGGRTACHASSFLEQFHIRIVQASRGDVLALEDVYMLLHEQTTMNAKL